MILRVTPILLLLALVAAQETPEFPDIWTMVEGSYETDVLVTFQNLDPETTMQVQEFYEIIEKQGVLHITDHANYQKINYFDKSKQMFIVQPPRLCEVGGLNQHPGYIMWGWSFTTGVDEENFLYGPSALLRIPKKHPAKYEDESSVRGIDSYRFISKFDNMTVEFMMAKEDWSMPHGNSVDNKFKAPLQVTVKGIQVDPWSDTQEEKDQYIIYDFLTFNPSLRDDLETYYEFELSSGLDCRGRETLEPGKGLPQLPNYFKADIEVTIPDPEMSLTVRSKIFYDFYRKILRIDRNEDNEVDKGNPIREFHDFNTGIYYKINDMTGHCDMGPIDPDQIGNAIGSGTIGNVIFGDPDNIFHLDESYVFSGYKQSEGVLVDRFTSVRGDIDNGEGGTYNKVVVDFEFTNEKVKIAGEVPGHSAPKRMRLTIFEDEDQSTILREESIYFEGWTSKLRDNEINNFDVRDCFTNPQDRTWIKVFFKGNFDLGMRDHEEEFKTMFIEKLYSNTKTSPIRVSEINIDHDEIFSYVIFLLLQPAPFLLQFNALEDHKPTENDYRFPDPVNDDENCAEQCLRHTKFQCKSFYECKNIGRGCFLSNYVQPNGNDFNVPNVCTHYKKVMVDNKLPIQDTNDLIEEWLELEIFRGDLKFDLTHEFENGTTILTTYTAKGYEEELLDDDPIFVDLLKGDFKPVAYGSKMRAPFIQVSLWRKNSYLECMIACDEQLSFECESFSYCYADNSCYLSNATFTKPMSHDDIVLQKDCNTHSRRHLDDYLPFDGFVSISDVQQTVLSVEDPDQCAYICDTVTNFTCRSFDFCIGEEVCYLHTTHVVDPGDSTIANNSECIHFSRSDMADFEKQDNVKVSGIRDIYYTDTSVVACAKYCEDDPDYKCTGFDFCNEEESVTCYLSENDYDGDFDVVDEPTCTHYKRIYYDGADHPPPRSSSKPYNSGDMAALGICMLIITMAATFGGVYAYNKFIRK